MCGLPGELEFTVSLATTSQEDPNQRESYEAMVRFDAETDGFGERDLLRDVPIGSDSQITASGQSSSTESIDIQSWLDLCSKNHCCLKEVSSDYVPPRLLDCGGGNLKLVEAEITLRFKSNSEDIRYVALSHCWGADPKVVLQTDNIEQFYGGIKLSSLPRTFQEAVSIVRRLNIPYIWIDSLCIIQKGPRHKEDWLRHVLEMAEIYSNCFLNIAASHSKDSNGGCFAERPTPLSRPCVAEINGKKALFEVSTYCQIDSFHLNSRAWVFQERLLSPRIIHYNGSEVFWECHELFASSLFLAGGPRLPFLLMPQRPQFHWELPSYQKDPYRHWLYLVEQYARCNLTRSSDRLPGIAAVARRMNETYFREEYIAGFFKSQLPLALIWERERWTKLEILEEHVAPTWSWASVKGKLDFDGVYSEKTAIATLKGVSVGLVDTRNSYGQVLSAKLAIEGQVLRLPAKSPTSINQRRAVLLG